MKIWLVISKNVAMILNKDFENQLPETCVEKFFTFKKADKIFSIWHLHLENWPILIFKALDKIMV